MKSIRTATEGDRWALLDAMRPPRIFVAERLGEVIAVGPGIAFLETVITFLERRGCTAAPLAPAVEAIGTQLPGENVTAIGWLRRIGASVEAWDCGMRRGSGVERRNETIYGSAIGALG